MRRSIGGSQRRIAAVFAGALFVPAAYAGPPFKTDDPVPTDRGHWEIYTYATGSRADDTTSGGAGLDMNYGAGEQLQLTVVVPAAWENAAGTTFGMGTVEMAAKYRFAGPASGSPVEIAVFPRVFLPTAHEGLGSSEVSVLLPVWLGRAAGPWYAFGGGGYQFNPGHGNKDFWTGGIALSRGLSEGVNLGAEIYGQTADAVDAKSFLGFNIGVVWSMSPHWSLLASGGAGLVHARQEGQNDFYLAFRADY
jgi:hypothetical protein